MDMMNSNKPDISGSLHRLPGLYLELGKARLTGLVVATTLMGYLVSSGSYIGVPRLVWTLIGTAFAAMRADSHVATSTYGSGHALLP